jgi:hypothetical protein
MTERYFEPTQAAGAAYFSRPIAGEIIMLNLLRFRAIADYAANPELAPNQPISGREAYQRYIDHTLPYLEASGGSIFLLGDSERYLIGPQEERWDLVMLIRQNSQQDFLAFATNPAYLAGMGHRTAAIEDSRLLPLVEFKQNVITEPKALR